MLSGLASAEISVEIDDRLVRGLDYYTRTVFEIVSGDLGAQNAVVGGGRYDGLIAEVGGDSVAAIGFAIGLDRLIDILPEAFVSRAAAATDTLVIPIGGVSPLEAVKAAMSLRDAGLSAIAETTTRSMKNALRRADRLGMRTVLLIGEDEMARGEVTVKDLATGEQGTVARTSLVDALKRRDEENGT